MKTRARTIPSQVPSGDERFRALVEGIQEYAIFLLDDEGRVVTWNAGAQMITGYGSDDIVGRPVDLLYAPDAIAEGLPKILLRQAKERGRVEQEGWRLHKNGTRFWADVAITCLTDDHGNCLGYATITRDLTERRLAESERSRRREDLLRLEERFRLLVESVEEYAIFMLDPDGIVSTWNIGAERIKGYTAGEVLGRHFSIFRTDEDMRSDACERELFLAAQSGKFEEEGWRVRKDGSQFWANVVLTAIRDSGGTLIGFAKITRDLTQRRALEEERLQRARAEEAARLREEFLLIASHELKTPLTSLQLDLGGIQQDLSGDWSKVSRKLERANRSVARLSALVESLLSVSRLAQGKLTLSPASMDLAETVVQVVDSLREHAGKAGCALAVQAPEPVLGNWDRLRIEQVVVNLLVNAIKYGAGEAVEIEVRYADTCAVIEVSDHGPGVPESDLLRIFQRFERASSIRHFGGLGLGLYVSHEIVVAHGGSITASNRPGGGAMFAVRLPADLPSSAARAVPPED